MCKMLNELLFLGCGAFRYVESTVEQYEECSFIHAIIHSQLFQEYVLCTDYMPGMF